MFSISQKDEHRQRKALECQPSLMRGSIHGGAAKDWLMLVSEFSQARDGHAFLVHLVSRSHQRQLPGTALRDLFGLIDQETEITARLMRNQSVRGIGECMALPHGAIRAHAKRILRKCGVRSRIELLALLHRISLSSEGFFIGRPDRSS